MLRGPARSAANIKDDAMHAPRFSTDKIQAIWFGSEASGQY
jgi:hypothetical protein